MSKDQFATILLISSMASLLLIGFKCRYFTGTIFQKIETLICKQRKCLVMYQILLLNIRCLYSTRMIYRNEIFLGLIVHFMNTHLLIINLIKFFIKDYIFNICLIELFFNVTNFIFFIYVEKELKKMRLLKYLKNRNASMRAVNIFFISRIVQGQRKFLSIILFLRFWINYIILKKKESAIFVFLWVFDTYISYFDELKSVILKSISVLIWIATIIHFITITEFSFDFEKLLYESIKILFIVQCLVFIFFHIFELFEYKKNADALRNQ